MSLRLLESRAQTHEATIQHLTAELEALEAVLADTLPRLDPETGQMHPPRVTLKVEREMAYRRHLAELHTQITQHMQHAQRCRRRLEVALAVGPIPHGQPGATPKLTPEVAAALCERVASGMSPIAAGRSMGIAKRTIQRWIRLGREEPGTRYGALCHYLRAAEEEQLVAAMDVLSDAMDPAHNPDLGLRVRAAQAVLRWRESRARGYEREGVPTPGAAFDPPPRPAVDLEQVARLADDVLERAEEALEAAQGAGDSDGGEGWPRGSDGSDRADR